MKLTKRQKFIASCCNPYYGGFASKKEVKIAKRQARGHYWIDTTYEEYVAISLTGRRAFFMYSFYSWATKRHAKQFMKNASRAARLWSKNKYKESVMVDNQNWNLYDSVS